MMKKITTIFILMLMLCSFGLSAQLIITDPAIIQEDSKNIEIKFNPALGNKGMLGQGTCYAHTGVITSKSDGSWKYAPTWGDNSEKYKMKIGRAHV